MSDAEAVRPVLLALWLLLVIGIQSLVQWATRAIDVKPHRQYLQRAALDRHAGSLAVGLGSPRRRRGFVAVKRQVIRFAPPEASRTDLALLFAMLSCTLAAAAGVVIYVVQVATHWAAPGSSPDGLITMNVLVTAIALITSVSRIRAHQHLRRLGMVPPPHRTHLGIRTW